MHCMQLKIIRSTYTAGNEIAEVNPFRAMKTKHNYMNNLNELAFSFNRNRRLVHSHYQ